MLCLRVNIDFATISKIKYGRIAFPRICYTCNHNVQNVARILCVTISFDAVLPLLWYIQHIPKFGSDVTSATSADKYLVYNTTPTVQTSIVLHSHDIDNRKHPGDQFILCNRRLYRRACCVVPQTSRRLDIIVVGFNEFKSCVHRWYSIQETLLDVESIYMIL